MRFNNNIMHALFLLIFSRFIKKSNYMDTLNSILCNELLYVTLAVISLIFRKSDKLILLVEKSTGLVKAIGKLNRKKK